MKKTSDMRREDLEEMVVNFVEIDKHDYISGLSFCFRNYNGKVFYLMYVPVRKIICT